MTCGPSILCTRIEGLLPTFRVAGISDALQAGILAALHLGMSDPQRPTPDMVDVRHEPDGSYLVSFPALIGNGASPHTRHAE